MDPENPSIKDMLLYGVFAISGVALVLVYFAFRETGWAEVSLNVGATLISTAVLAFIYQRFGSKDLLHQIAEMRRSLVIAQRGLELGLRDM